jgi:hypothetical protein
MLPDYGPVGPEIWMSFCVKKQYCNYKEVCAFCWLTLERFYHNTWNGKCKIAIKYPTDGRLSTSKLSTHPQMA